jgi:hypothetical protein
VSGAEAATAAPAEPAARQRHVLYGLVALEQPRGGGPLWMATALRDGDRRLPGPDGQAWGETPRGAVLQLVRQVCDMAFHAEAQDLPALEYRAWVRMVLAQRLLGPAL